MRLFAQTKKQNLVLAMVEGSKSRREREKKKSWYITTHTYCPMRTAQTNPAGPAHCIAAQHNLCPVSLYVVRKTGWARAQGLQAFCACGCQGGHSTRCHSCQCLQPYVDAPGYEGKGYPSNHPYGHNSCTLDGIRWMMPVPSTICLVG